MDITSFLARYKGDILYYKGNPGNGGDALIAAATFQVFASAGIAYRIVDDAMDLDDKLVCYAGGGNLVDYYHNCARFIQKWEKRVRLLILLPHTVSGHRELLSSIEGKVQIICREAASFAYVSSFANLPPPLLMDDLALQLDTAQLIDVKLQHARLFRHMRLKRIAKFLLTEPISRWRWLWQKPRGGTITIFRTDVERSLQGDPAAGIDLPDLVNLDPMQSNPEKVAETAARILSFLSRYDTIQTNRLHIAIAGALLGKEVQFYGNAYFKNKRVFEYSLKDRFPLVRWMDQ